MREAAPQRFRFVPLVPHRQLSLTVDCARIDEHYCEHLASPRLQQFNTQHIQVTPYSLVDLLLPSLIRFPSIILMSYALTDPLARLVAAGISKK